MESNNTKSICPETHKECVQHPSQCSTVCWELQYDQRKLNSVLIHFSTLDKMPTLGLLDREGVIEHVVNIAKEKLSATPSKEVERGEGEKPIAGDVWKEHIQQFSKLAELWATIPEPANIWLSQQIDIFAGKYPVKRASAPLPEGKGVEEREAWLIEKAYRKGVFDENYFGEELDVEESLIMVTAELLAEPTPNPSPKVMEDWSQLSKIAPPHKWLEVYGHYQELLTREDVAGFWHEQFSMANERAKGVEGLQWQVDFGNHLRALLSSNGKELTVQAAIDGWGNEVPISQVVIEPTPLPVNKDI